MSNRYTAVEQVMGRLFDRERPNNGGSLRRQGGGGRSGRSSGGQGPSLSRMSRVGARHGQAIFKLVRTGGVDSKGGLKGQLNYIFRDDKVAEVIDPSGIVKAHDEPTNQQINRLVTNLSDNWWAKTRNGQTSHMILSFPQGTSIKDVAEIVRDVCEEKFDSGDVRYKYVAAIHDDQEHHPHAHIVLNRRGSDNSLFNMRRDTDHSYEAFREAMAAHAERRGIMLDSTSRFERGITDRQPTQTEQWNASREGRAPAQRPRTGADLQYAQQIISFAQIGYEAMAVIAANADCARLERTYHDMANMLMSSEGEYKMPVLSADELEKFDQYASLLNDALAKSQEVLLTKDATARVPYEKQLTDNMAAFTALSPDAGYAKGLHEDPRGQSIYMHETGNRYAPSEMTERIEQYTQGTGLEAQAITARLQTGAGNLYLEQMWMQDDLRQLAKASDLNLSDPNERQQAVSELTNAYQEIREDLIENRMLRVVPHLEADYLNEKGQRQITEIERRDLTDAFNRQDWQPGRGADENHYEDVMSGIDELRQQSETVAEQSRSHAIVVSELWDKHGAAFDKPVGYLAEDEREREAPEQATLEVDRFAELKARSSDDYMLTNSAEEHQEVIRLLKENTTDAQYDRFRRGDLTAIDHITDDKVFSRQLLMQAEMNNRSTGFEMSDETERLMTDSRDFLKDNFETDRDRGYENER